MTPMEIALLIIGVIIFVLSFFLPDGKVKKTEKQIEEEQEEIRKLMEQELDGMKLKVNEATNDSVDYAVDRAERSLEKVSNEKIMAVNEYSQTIIEEINKNHQEVMFLYDMLKDKHTDLTNSVREADAKAKEIQNLSASAANASKGLQQELTVVAVTKKGLTDEQKAVFDEVEPSGTATIPAQNKAASGAVSVSMQNGIAQGQTPQARPRLASAAVQQSIMSSLAKDGPTVAAQPAAQPSGNIVYDVMSGTSFSQNGGGYVANGPSSPGRQIPPSAVAATTPEQTPQEVNNNNRRILELHKQGMSTVDIAKELKLGVGEVKLVIDLFK